MRDVLFEKLAQKRAQKRSRRGATDTTLTDEETQMCDNLFDAIDANGDASSPTFTFPQVPVGTELAIAAVTRSPIGFSTVTKPLIVRSQ